ncbi:SDR family NAD(P)-dependent oxidoreductase [Gordonia sp. (in: high G+C Gram-positive bacteria)]|uniref:SDR family NAD(P)-dependent oxidoreductase n=1 Tax=Gordonia sp. (in: high G+C Gram-positive bacteria) TaxID=84139 RepID=UPI001D1AF780|nr:SDR family oxidoreductase [Gordonia sp. (in: high G+C Gram-positive bacteria)]MCB1296803.1 SDR family oxidoreductase [Gordonia sp. (in: high G+C Gram-positive bacteria)]HMS76388.1 SDR family oxidoreductase [Gordonia sp. (in: high G+C Gram-positive bacteria)]HQV19058.1 SDR family oxidoreductase [Gordonia sp. (in: high G+C Gram-positive bacteria)]
MDLGFADAVVVVNGGTKGMGRAAAETVAAEGAKVALLARGEQGLNDTAARLTELGAPDVLPIPTDLNSRTDIDAAFATIGERWGVVNTLVNAVGPIDVGIGPLESIDDDNWHATFDIGTLSAVKCVEAALPLLRKAEWARIVNVSAHSVRRQSPTLIAYTAAKAALTSVSKNLAQTLAPEGILVNTVSPGSFLSQGLRDYLSRLPDDRRPDLDDLYAVMDAIDAEFGHPAFIRRAGLPSEIGPVIAFAGSRTNTYMTGADLNVDGGSDF